MTFDHLSPEEIVETRLTYQRAAEILSRKVRSSEDRLAAIDALADAARLVPANTPAFLAERPTKTRVEDVRSLILLLAESARSIAQPESDEIKRQLQTAEARIAILLKKEAA